MIATMTMGGYYTMQSGGNSSAAEYLAGRLNDVREHLQESYALRGLKASGLYDELDALAEECGEANWDGYGADPVSEGSYWLAREFLDALPIGAGPTSVGADPDGQVTLEWHHSAYRTLSLSVDPNRVIHYAALLGSATMHGTEPFYGAVPRSIAELIARVSVK